jgi:hypothetical protein
MSSLYRRLLGAAFDTLPPTLQNFHDVTTAWSGRADFRITRGRGLLRNFVATMGGLPAAGDDVPMHLRIIKEGDGERWIREFAGRKLVSLQKAADGLLVESFGSITLGFRLVAAPPELQLIPARAWILGMPFPRALAPSGTGIEVGRDDGCAIVARAFAPLLGEIVRYEGLVVADPV